MNKKKKTSGYFASFITLPVVINATGQYLTRGGEIITLTHVSRANDFGNVGTYPNGTQDMWHRSGRLFAGQESQNDIVSVLTP